MLEAFKLRNKTEEEECLRNKDFLIIFCKANIFSLYFVYIASAIAAIIDMTVLAIDYLIVRFMLVVEKL